jgi:hypothetical protein
MAEEVTLQTSTGAAKELDGTDEPATPADQSEPDGTSNGPAHDTTRQPDTERLQERGVALHGMSEDEEDDTDEEGAQEMTGGRGKGCAGRPVLRSGRTHPNRR